MKLESYARKYGVNIYDWSDTLEDDLLKEGGILLAVFSDDNDCEPDMLLIKMSELDNYQVRNISTNISSGTMLSERHIKEWIKRNYGAKR